MNDELRRDLEQLQALALEVATEESRKAFEAWIADVPLHERTPWQVWSAAVHWMTPKPGREAG
jgi:hypothetical protein